jgi:hypothetical protein
MTNNLTPWIVLGGIVLVSLYWKGYFGKLLPSSRLGFSRSAAIQAMDPNAANVQTPNPNVSNVTHGDASPAEAWLLERLDAETLGVYFALAMRRRAESEVARKIAEDAGDKIKATFAAPFAPAPPAAGEPAPAPEAKPGS